MNILPGQSTKLKTGNKKEKTKGKSIIVSMKNLEFYEMKLENRCGIVADICCSYKLKSYKVILERVVIVVIASFMCKLCLNWVLLTGVCLM